MSTVTVTFCEIAENHVGMQKIGKDEPVQGFSTDELINLSKILGDSCEYIDLVSCLKDDNNHLIVSQELLGCISAGILVIKNGASLFLTKEELPKLKNELFSLDYDKKAKMYGRVVNKNARYNLCFDTVAQAPDYTEGKGRVVSFNEIPYLKKIRDNLHLRFGEVAKDLVAEANYYYNTATTGISYHGDSERNVVIGLRIGDDLSLCYKWFYKGKHIGKKIKITLSSNDIYIMSAKAVGTDWKSKNILTLRHAAGCDKYTN
jgi:hypothetical protein